MTPEQHKHLFELFTWHAADALSAQEHAELQEVLRSNAEARRLWFVHQDVGMGLHAHLVHEPVQLVQQPGRNIWASWRPLTAAAAGLALGLFSASLVFGYVVPSLKTRIELFSDGFESGGRPSAGGQPLEAGRWSGDYTEVSTAAGTVRPAEGNHMLRFLRADYEGHDLPDSFSSDSFYLLDVRPYKKEFVDGTAVVRLSALFNGEVAADEGPFACVLMLFALDEFFVTERKSGAFTGSIRERMLTNSSSTRVRLDADASTWQQAGNELRLPPGTDFLMLQVGMSNDSKRKEVRKDAFAAHYVDGVRLVLAHMPEVSLP